MKSDTERPRVGAGGPEPPGGAEMFANRLRKNLRGVGKWAKKEGVDCYRLYDADMPEYSLAVDIYGGEERWVHCQEYAAPKSIDPERARIRLDQALSVIPQVLEIDPARIFLKVRQRQRAGNQYEKQGRRGRFYLVSEDACRFWVNFTDYLDTGLFLDHRITRELVGKLAAQRHFLNLFAYTGTASVHAAVAGALSTTTVDLSSTYLDWARRNMSTNGCGGEVHRFIQTDCLQWLEHSGRRGGALFDVIFLDPPTVSRSKRMEQGFDVQRDHASLIRQTCRLLAPEGILVFSNNFRRFRMAREILEDFSVEDVTARTIPRDFQRNPKIHNCWLISKKI